MDISLGKPFDEVVDALVRDGRYASPREVVEEGLRLVEAREKQREWLRAKLQRAIDEGGSYTDEEVGAALDAAEEQLRARGL